MIRPRTGSGSSPVPWHVQQGPGIATPFNVLSPNCDYGILSPLVPGIKCRSLDLNCARFIILNMSKNERLDAANWVDVEVRGGWKLYLDEYETTVTRLSPNGQSSETTYITGSEGPKKIQGGDNVEIKAVHHQAFEKEIPFSLDPAMKQVRLSVHMMDSQVSAINLSFSGKEKSEQLGYVHFQFAKSGALLQPMDLPKKYYESFKKEAIKLAPALRDLALNLSPIAALRLFRAYVDIKNLYVHYQNPWYSETPWGDPRNLVKLD